MHLYKTRINKGNILGYLDQIAMTSLSNSLSGLLSSFPEKREGGFCHLLFMDNDSNNHDSETTVVVLGQDSNPQDFIAGDIDYSDSGVMQQALDHDKMLTEHDGSVYRENIPAHDSHSQVKIAQDINHVMSELAPLACLQHSTVAQYNDNDASNVTMQHIGIEGYFDFFALVTGTQYGCVRMATEAPELTMNPKENRLHHPLCADDLLSVDEDYGCSYAMHNDLEPDYVNHGAAAGDSYNGDKENFYLRSGDLLSSFDTSNALMEWSISDNVVVFLAPDSVVTAKASNTYRLQGRDHHQAEGNFDDSHLLHDGALMVNSFAMRYMDCYDEDSVAFVVADDSLDSGMVAVDVMQAPQSIANIVVADSFGLATLSDAKQLSQNMTNDDTQQFGNTQTELSQFTAHEVVHVTDNPGWHAPDSHDGSEVDLLHNPSDVISLVGDDFEQYQPQAKLKLDSVREDGDHAMVLESNQVPVTGDRYHDDQLSVPIIFDTSYSLPDDEELPLPYTFPKPDKYTQKEMLLHDVQELSAATESNPVLAEKSDHVVSKDNDLSDVRSVDLLLHNNHEQQGTVVEPLSQLQETNSAQTTFAQPEMDMSRDVSSVRTQDMSQLVDVMSGSGTVEKLVADIDQLELETLLSDSEIMLSDSETVVADVSVMPSSSEKMVDNRGDVPVMDQMTEPSVIRKQNDVAAYSDVRDQVIDDQTEQIVTHQPQLHDTNDHQLSYATDSKVMMPVTDSEKMVEGQVNPKKWTTHYLCKFRNNKSLFLLVFLQYSLNRRLNCIMWIMLVMNNW